MILTVLQTLSSTTALVFGTLLYRFLWRRDRSKLPLPPGPRGIPVFGNLFQLPKKYEWDTYHHWCQELDTDILYLNAAGTHLVILDSLEATTAVFDRNSAVCSGRQVGGLPLNHTRLIVSMLINHSRPRMVMVRELMGWDSAFQFKDYGDEWREHRKIFHQEMNAVGAQRLRPHQVRATQRFLKRLMTSSAFGGASVVEEVRNISGEIAVSITYGFELSSETNRHLQLSKDAIDPLVETLTPGGSVLVDALPFLKHLPSWAPGAAFKKKAKLADELRKQMFDVTYTEAISGRGSSQLAPSFVSCGLDSIDPSRDITKQEEDIKLVAGSIYAAAGETTLAVVSTAIYILLNNPDVLKRAQKEIDDVVGFGTLPSFEDEKALPFTRSLILEIQRWKAPVPLGLPHVSTDEVIYKGYRIPKRSMILGNTLGILHDEKTFKDAHLFKPDRYLMPDGKSIDKSVMEPSAAIFGYGRRVCPGRYVAEASIWTILSSLIAVFNLHRVDETGGPDHQFQIGLLRIPNEFRARFEPRSEAIRIVVNESKET